MACIIGVASTTASLAAASRAHRGTRATQAAPRLGVRRAGGFAAGAPLIVSTAVASRSRAAVTPAATIAEPNASARAASLIAAHELCARGWGTENVKHMAGGLGMWEEIEGFDVGEVPEEE